MKLVILAPLVLITAVSEAKCWDASIDIEGGPPPNQKIDLNLNNNVNEQNQIELRGNTEKIDLDTMSVTLGAMDSKLDSNMASIIALITNNSHMLDILHVVNSMQDRKLDTIINTLGNLCRNPGAGINLDSSRLGALIADNNAKLDVLKDANAIQNTKLDFILQALGGLSLNTGYNSLSVSVLKDNADNSNGESRDSDLKLNHFPSIKECPGHMFSFGVGKDRQCFKFFNDAQRQWFAANLKCQQENLILAEPKDPIPLREYLVKTYNPSIYTWLGAQGDGSTIRWLHGGNPLSDTRQHLKGGTTTTNDYLFLLTTWDYLHNYPSQPYYTNGGSFYMYTLCELILN